MSYKVFIFIAAVIAVLYYFLSSFFAPIGSIVNAKGIVMGQTVGMEANVSISSVWFLTFNKGIAKVSYADNTGCVTELGPKLQFGDVVEFQGIFQDTLLVSLCKDPNGYFKKGDVLTPTLHKNETGQD